MFDFDYKSNKEQVMREFRQKTQKALNAMGLVAVGYAKQNAPVKTGRLRNSIDKQVDETDVYIGTNVEYAPMQEVKHNFLRDAAADHTEEYTEILRQAFSS